MKELLEAVNKLMLEEYNRAAEKFGPKNNGPHESYAVIKEEVEEAAEELGTVNSQLEYYWFCVRENKMDEQNGKLKMIENFALKAAAECIQVAAMAYKARK